MSRVEEHLAPLGYPLPLVHPSGMTVLVTDRAPLDRPIAVLRRQSASTLLARASIGLRCRFRWRSLLLERSDVQLTPNVSIWCRLFGRAGSPKRVAFRSALQRGAEAARPQAMVTSQRCIRVTVTPKYSTHYILS